MSQDELRDAEPVHTFDEPSTELTTAIVAAIAEVSGDDPGAIDPIHDVIDPDALNALFAPTSDPYARINGRVEFAYYGYRIVVGAHGRGYIYELSDDPSAAPDSRRSEPKRSL